MVGRFHHRRDHLSDGKGQATFLDMVPYRFGASNMLANLVRRTTRAEGLERESRGGVVNLEGSSPFVTFPTPRIGSDQLWSVDEHERPIRAVLAALDGD